MKKRQWGIRLGVFLGVVSGLSISAADVPVLGTQVAGGHTPETMTIKSKCAKSLFLVFFDGTFHQLRSIVLADGRHETMYELKPNEVLTLKPTKKQHDEWWIVYLEDPNALSISVLQGKGDKDKDRYVFGILDNTTTNHLKALDGETFSLFKNKEGLIPGLLRGAGDLGDRTKMRLNKLNALRLQYFDKNGASIITKSPDDYTKALASSARRGSAQPGIEGVIDDVLNFEIANGY